MNIEGNFNNQQKLANLRALIKRAEINGDEKKGILLEAELRALEKGEVFNPDQFITEQATKEEERKKLRNRKHNILRNMQSIPGSEYWSYDGIEGINNYRNSYEYTFEYFLNNLEVDNFQELVDKRSKELKKKLKILDLFGGAYFVRDLKNVSQITGVRLNDIDQKLLKESENDPGAQNYLKPLIGNKKRNIIIGNLYEGATWKEIENDSHSGKGFDLIVCRPEGPFRNAMNKNQSIEGVSDTGLSREEIFVSLLEKTLKLLSNNEGMLFTQTPALKTPSDVTKKFWEDYAKRKSLEGYKFIFDNNESIPDKSFVVIKNKV